MDPKKRRRLRQIRERKRLPSGAVSRHARSLYGPLGVIDAEDGRKSFKMYASLQRQLDGVTDGTEVLIVYRGEKRSRAGRDFKLFDVYTKEAEERPEDGVEAPF